MTMHKERLHGMLLVLLASMCWGTSGTIQALAPEGISTLSMGAVRITMSGTVLLAWCRWREGSLAFLRRASIPALLVTTVGLAGFQFTFFGALRLTGVSIGTMITIGASPVIAGLLGALVEREPLSARWCFSTLVALSGCALLIFGGASGPIAPDLRGVALAFFASFCYSLMGLGLKMQGRRLTDIQATAAATGLSLIVGVPALLLLNPSWIFTGSGVVLVFSLGLVTMVFPILFFSMGLRKIFLRDAYTIALSEPVTAFVLSALVLGERLSLVSVSGAALICCGILLLPITSENGKSLSAPEQGAGVQ